MAPPILTIGIPTYNGSRTIEDSIESITRQITDNVEIVISDNASTDNTYEIIKKYQCKNPSILYFRNNENLGIDHIVPVRDLQITDHAVVDVAKDAATYFY